MGLLGICPADLTYQHPASSADGPQFEAHGTPAAADRNDNSFIEAAEAMGFRTEFEDVVLVRRQVNAHKARNGSRDSSKKFQISAALRAAAASFVAKPLAGFVQT